MFSALTADALNTAPVVADNGVVISTNDNTILGNPFYGYESNNGRKTRGVQSRGSVGETYINWQDEQGYNIQDVIDNVLPLVLSLDSADIPNIRLMCVPAVYDKDGNSQTERPLLCIPYTDKIQRAYRQVYGDETEANNNKGVMTVDVDGKPEKFLIIGCAGYDNNNRQLGALNKLRSDPKYVRALEDARQSNSKNPVIIPNIEYTFTKQGLTAGRMETVPGLLTSTASLLHEEESNPQHLQVASLGLCYVDANGNMVGSGIDLQVDPQTKSMRDDTKTKRAGQYYLLVPNGKSYSKILLNPPILQPYTTIDADIYKSDYHDNLKNCLREVFKNLQESNIKNAKQLLSEYIYLNGDVKFDFGDDSTHVITITRPGGSVVVLNGEDIDSDFRALCVTGVRISMPRTSKMRTALLESGLLCAKAVSLNCFNKTFAIKPVGQTQSTQQQTSQTQSQRQTSSARTTTKVKVNGVEYTQNNQNVFSTNTDVNNLCNIALQIRQKKLSCVDSSQFSNYYEKEGNIYVLEESGLRKATAQEVRNIKDWKAKQQADQAVSTINTNTTISSTSQSDPNTGFDSSQQGVNSNNAPVDVKALRQKSDQIQRNRDSGSKGLAVTTVAGLLLGNKPERAKVGNIDVEWSATPGALPATQVGNIMDVFFRLCFQSDVEAFHNAARHGRLNMYFPNISEECLKIIYNRAMQLKRDLMPDGEDNYEVIADELWLETTVPVQVGETQKALLVHGKPDLIIRNKITGKYIIADFKTKYANDVDSDTSGNFKNTDYDKKTQLKYWYQLQLYKKALEDMGCQVENTRLIVSGVNYSRAFNVNAYNQIGIYTSDGTFMPASTETASGETSLTPFYDNALNAKTSTGEQPFNNAANQSTAKKNQGIHYKPKPLEDDSYVADQINSANGYGVLVDSITDEVVPVRVGRARVHIANSLVEGQSVNAEMVLDEQILIDNDIKTPERDYKKPQVRQDLRRLRHKIKNCRDLSKANLVEILNTALAYSNSTENLSSVEGVIQGLTTILKFKDEESYLHQDVITYIKDHKTFPEFLNKFFKNIKFSDDDIHKILTRIAQLDVINVDVSSSNSGAIADKYKNELESSNYTVDIDGNTWTINGRIFTMTDNGLVANNSDDAFIKKLKAQITGITIISKNSATTNDNINLSPQQQQYLQQGAKLNDNNLVAELIGFIKNENQQNSTDYGWINHEQSNNILKGWLDDNFPDWKELKKGVARTKFIMNIKKKLECFK